MWAYPNFIPLSPSVLHEMWKRLKPFEFAKVYSLFIGRDIHGQNLKGQILNDMKMQARFAGHEVHPLLDEDWQDYEDEAGSIDLPNGLVRGNVFASPERKF